MNKLNISDFVKAAPESHLLVLACLVKEGPEGLKDYGACDHYKPFILHRVVGDFCASEIVLLLNRKGKSEIYRLCEYKYNRFKDHLIKPGGNVGGYAERP